MYLTNQLCIRGKSLMTTDDAVILTANGDKDYAQFTQAYRLIHGPKGGLTECPYILLFSDADFDILDVIVSNLIENLALQEFPDPNDTYAVPILYMGSAADERIQWDMV